LLGEVLKTGEHQCTTETELLSIGIHADDEDLTDRRGTRVHFGPAVSDEIGVAPSQQEAVGIEPRLGHPASERVGDPSALVGVVQKRSIVDAQPRGFIPSGSKGATFDSRGPRGLPAHGQRDSHLVLLSIDDESTIGQCVNNAVITPGHPCLETTLTRCRRLCGQHRIDQGSDSPRFGVGTSSDEELAVSRCKRIRSGGDRGRRSIRAHHQTRRAIEAVQRAPHAFGECFVAGIGRGGIVDRPQHREVGIVDQVGWNRGSHRARRYFPPMARPRGAKQRTALVVDRLSDEYPGSAEDLCALRHDTPFQLLAATILSAQCTDEMVNSVTPTLFERYPTPGDLAAANPETVEEIIHPTGFFRQKTKSLVGMATAVRDRFDGEVPTELDDLVTLPGVGRKTANVLRSVAFDLPGLPVDTHVGRLASRLKLTNETDPVKVELDLNGLIDPSERGGFSLRLILHGRRVCGARQPKCDDCMLADICPSAGRL